MPPILLALDAEVVLERSEKKAGIGGQRGRTPLAHGPDRRVLRGLSQVGHRPDEVVRWVILPRNRPLVNRAHAPHGLVQGQQAARARHQHYGRQRSSSTPMPPGTIDVHARLAFGGVAATPARARKTEAFLSREASGKQDTIASRLGDPRHGVHAARRSALRRGVPTRPHREPVREVLPRRDEHAAGRAPRLRADAADRPRRRRREPRARRTRARVGHVTGAALYVDDVAKRRDMLEIWPVSSPHARARAISIDTARGREGAGASPRC